MFKINTLPKITLNPDTILDEFDRENKYQTGRKGGWYSLAYLQAKNNVDVLTGFAKTQRSKEPNG